MDFKQLIKLKNGGSLVISERVFSGTRKDLGEFGVSQQSMPMKPQDKASKILGENVLSFGKADGGGVWIPYLPKASVYDFLNGGQTWFASGPFSGCWFEVGKLNGQYYAAHISCEGRNDVSKERFDANGEVAGKEVLFCERIRMAEQIPDGCSFPQAIVFASITGDKLEVVRVDVRGSSFGSLSGAVFNVTQLV